VRDTTPANTFSSRKEENTMMNNQKQTILYSRLSREDERETESLSIENQKSFLEDYAMNTFVQATATIPKVALAIISGTVDKPQPSRLAVTPKTKRTRSYPMHLTILFRFIVILLENNNK